LRMLGEESRSEDRGGLYQVGANSRAGPWLVSEGNYLFSGSKLCANKRLVALD
jgi:hypothetical protein